MLTIQKSVIESVTYASVFVRRPIARSIHSAWRRRLGSLQIFEITLADIATPSSWQYQLVFAVRMQDLFEVQ